MKINYAFVDITTSMVLDYEEVYDYDNDDKIVGIVVKIKIPPYAELMTNKVVEVDTSTLSVYYKNRYVGSITKREREDLEEYCLIDAYYYDGDCWIYREELES